MTYSSQIGTPISAHRPGDETSSVFRSSVDERVWMCNIPETDIADGIQASTSLRKIKAYVEQIQARFGIVGAWVKVGDDHYEYQSLEEP